jgi:5-methylcytosine-specific restriction endonuclease McrA
MCLQCRTLAKDKVNKKKSLGLCISCPKPKADDSIYCNDCLIKRRNYEKKRETQRKEKGLCSHCPGKLSISNITYCEICWWRQKASHAMGSGRPSNIELIKNIFNKQDGKCAFTGEPLILGQNASLDHIIPKCKGGSSTIDNLQWVLTSINSGKHDLTQEEFIRLCKLVAKNHST